MLRLLNSDSAIVAVVDHRNPVAGWQTVQCWLILEVPCGRRTVADGRLFNLLDSIGIVDVGLSSCGNLTVLQLIGRVVTVGGSSAADVLECSVASGIVRVGLPISICSCAIFTSELVLFVVAPFDSC
jgi:hypothetical protein